MNDKRRPLLLGLLALAFQLGTPWALANANTDVDKEHQADFERQEKQLNENVGGRYDWAIVLSAHALKQFLEYKGSKLYPVAAVDANYADRDDKGPEFGNLKIYETYWFHDAHGLGVWRHMRLSLKDGSNGALFIDDTPDAPSETKSLANAITRVLLDVHWLKANLTVVAPENICEQLSADLGLFRFRPIHQISSGQRGILLHMSSTSRKFDRYFWFDR